MHVYGVSIQYVYWKSIKSIWAKLLDTSAKVELVQTTITEERFYDVGKTKSMVCDLRNSDVTTMRSPQQQSTLSTKQRTGGEDGSDDKQDVETVKGY